MLFNSYPFLLFLPIVFAAYWAFGRRTQNVVLLAASYVFYGFWDWRFLGLIVLSSLVDFVAGQAIQSGRRRRMWLGASLLVNLGALAVFKYLDFGIESLAALLRTLGFDAHPATLGIVVPVGISFYTFQTLSYTLDVYRGRVRATQDPLAFFAFVAFFPQLVAGPIERAKNLLPQFLRDRVFDPELATDGCRQMLYGLLLKVVVADNLALVADAAYQAPDQADGWTLLFATWAFAFQIYADFAGYSHIAIGCARLFGFSLMRNFATPYFSRSPAEFWRRWHISLSTWFRDYVYIPLGGNRVAPLRASFNVLVTFVSSGLWHGAGLTFVVWGGFHGLLVALQARLAPDADERPLEGRTLTSPRELGRLILTFQLVCVGWVFFRAKSLADAWLVLRTISSGIFTALPHGASPALLVIPPLLVLEWWQRDAPHGFARLGGTRPARWGLYATALLALALFGQVQTVPFVYFQF